MSGRSRCSVPRNAAVADSNTRSSYEGSLPANSGVPGSGGRPVPGGAQSNRAGNRRGWMQVHPAAVSWAGVTPSAAAGPAVARVAPPASAAATAAAAIRALALIRGIFMIALLPGGRHAGSAAVRGGGSRWSGSVAVSVAGGSRPAVRRLAEDQRPGERVLAGGDVDGDVAGAAGAGEDPGAGLPVDPVGAGDLPA